MRPCTRDMYELLTLNIPLVLEKIFVDYLDYPDMVSCLQVSKHWHKCLIEKVFHSPIVRRKLQRTRLSHLWTKGHLEQEEPIYPMATASRICLISKSASGILIASTKHGQRQVRLMLVDTKGCVQATRDLSLRAPLISINAKDDVIVILSRESEPLVLDSTLEVRSDLDLAGTRRMYFADNGGAIFNVLSKVGGNPDTFLLRKLDLSQQCKMLPYRFVRLDQNHDHDAGDCSGKMRLHLVTSEHFVVACIHGHIQLFHHVSDTSLWSGKYLSINADGVVGAPVVASNFVAVVYEFHRNACKEFQALLLGYRDGHLINRFSFRGYKRPLIACSDRFFAMSYLDTRSENILFVAVLDNKNMIKRTHSVVVSNADVTTSKLWILNDSLLFLECLEGPPRQMTGLVHIVDLNKMNGDSHPIRRTISGLKPFAPRHGLLTLLSPISFVSLSSKGLDACDIVVSKLSLNH